MSSLARFDAAKQEAEDAAVLARYARFEARLREQIAQHAPLLAAAVKPDPQFGAGLAELFQQQVERHRRRWGRGSRTPRGPPS